MTRDPVALAPDPFSPPPKAPSSRCQICDGSIDRQDVYCRTCRIPGPTASDAQTSEWLERTSAPKAAASSSSSSLRVNGALLVLASLLLAAGTKLPWISPDGLTFQFGSAPPVSEVWPVLAAAAALGLLGLVALPYTERMSPASWLISLLVALGVAGLMIPRVREINQGIVDAGGLLGIAQGVGVWAIGAGVIVGLLAGASGWGNARHSAPPQGFTIIEAAVAVLVTGTVFAVAVPHFLQRDTAQAAPGISAQSVGWMEPVLPGIDSFGGARPNTAAQSEVLEALLAQKAYWLETGDYTADPANLLALNPDLNLASSPRAGVALTLGDADSDRVCLTRTAASGVSFSVWEDVRRGTYYGTSDLSVSCCPAAPPASYSQGGW